MPVPQNLDADYEGLLDKKYLRQGFGSEIIYRKPGTEIYNGNFTNSLYHGEGQYISRNLLSPWTFEGRFFANKKESYGSMSYSDGSVFQGLYRNDHQFGPGVLIYPNGGQDVGFWWGSKMIRVIQPVEGVVILGSTPLTKSKLIKFKKLIDITKYHEDTARDIMNKLKVSKCFMKFSDLLYSHHAKNPSGQMFDKKMFLANFANDFVRIDEEIVNLSPQKSVNICLKTPLCDMIKLDDQSEEQRDDSLENDNPRLLAWNNNSFWRIVLQHCFQNSQYESLVNFDVSSVLLGKRENFPEVGEHEEDCLNFLNSCANGDYQSVFTLLAQGKVYPDLSDKKGNSAVFLAAAHDQVKIIELLSAYGAMLDNENDEGLTPLTYILCRYIAVKKNIKSWGEAFLSHEPHPPIEGSVKTWKSTTSIELASLSTSKTYQSADKNKVKKKKYIFDTSQEQGKKEQKKILGKSGGTETAKSGKKIKKSSKKSSKKKNPPKKSPKKKNSPKKSSRKKRSKETPTGNSKIEETEESSSSSLGVVISKHVEENETLKTIEATVQKLLEEGADSNLSNVPAVPILLSIVCGNMKITAALLNYCADPNATLLHDATGFTGLHLLCLLKPQSYFPELVHLFLKYNADPQLRTKPNYEKATAAKLMIGAPEGSFSNDGVTPLQALCLRPDANRVKGKEYLQVICSLLVKVTDRYSLFLGHSPLTLAVFRSNANLAAVVINYTPENPNRIVHPLHGNALTVIVKYFPFIKEPLPMVNLLASLGANPLTLVDMEESQRGNVMNYLMLKKKLYISDDFGKKEPPKKKKGKRGKSKKGSKGTKRKMKGKRKVKTKTGESSGKKEKKSTGKGDKKSKSSKKKSKSSKGKSKSSKAKSKSKSSKRETPTAASASSILDDKQALRYFEFMKLMQIVTRDKINKYIQGKIFRILSFSIYENGALNANHWLLRQLYNWLTPKEFTDILVEHVSQRKSNLIQSNAIVLLDLFSKEKVEEFFYSKEKAQEASETGSNAQSAMELNIQGRFELFPREELLERINAAYEAISKRRQRSRSKCSSLPAPVVINYDLHPELDREDLLYQVCYRCGIRRPNLAVCSDCHLVSFCCLECESEDTYDLLSKHLCKAGMRKEVKPNKKESSKKKKKSSKKKSSEKNKSKKSSKKKTSSSKKKSSKGSKSRTPSRKILCELRWPSHLKRKMLNGENSSTETLPVTTPSYNLDSEGVSSGCSSSGGSNELGRLTLSSRPRHVGPVERKLKPSIKRSETKSAFTTDDRSWVTISDKVEESKEDNENLDVLPDKCCALLEEFFKGNVLPDFVLPYLFFKNGHLYVKKTFVHKKNS